MNTSIQDSVLIVDADAQSSFDLCRHVEGGGFRALAAHDWEAGMQSLGDPSIRVLLLDDDTRLGQGRRLLDGIRQIRPDLDLVLMVPRGRIRSVVEAMKTGASDCLTKPVEGPQLIQTVKQCMRNRELESEIQDLRGQLDRRRGLDGIIGNSLELLQAASLARKVADYPVSVMICGESGTGKELFAGAIHRLSGRHAGPFVAVDCAAWPVDLVESELFGYERGAFTGAENAKPGRLELADGGTLFIDEVGNLPASLQIKLLRVLQQRRYSRLGSNQERPVDVRLICATNVGLKEAIADGSFREDLYHRLNEFSITLPPLRRRGDDVELLAHFFLHRYGAQFGKKAEGFSVEAMAKLLAYPWPGNIRQLHNAVKQAVILSSGCVESSCLPREITDYDPKRAPRPSGGLPAPFRMPDGIQPLWDARQSVAAQLERQAILEALRRHRWNRIRTAEALGIHVKTLGRKIREQGIQ